MKALQFGVISIEEFSKKKKFDYENFLIKNFQRHLILAVSKER
jgi:hypothetical protein